MMSKIRWFYTQLNSYLIVFLGMAINAVGRARHEVAEPSGNVAVVKLDHLGDLVIAAPVIQWVRSRAASLTVVVGAWNVPIARLITDADTVVAYSPPLFARTKHSARPNVAGLRDVLLMLWASDCIYVLRGTVLISVVCLLLSPWKVVRARERYRLAARLTSRTALDHEVNQMARVVGAPEIDLSSAPLASIVKVKRRGRPTAIVNFGALSPLRVWSSDGWVRVLQELHQLGFELIAHGQPTDHYDQGLVELCDVNRIGKVALSDLPREVSAASLMVGSDGGLVHLASALGIPTVALFGPTSPVLFRPIGQVRVVYDDFRCSPCSGVRCILRNPDDRCMKVLSAGRVIEAIHDLLRTRDIMTTEKMERMH